METITQVKQFIAPEGTEIMGIGIQGVFANLSSTEIDPILEEYGLTADAIDANEWYSLQLYFDLYKELAERGGTGNLVAIGKATAQNVTNPDEIDGIRDFVERVINETATSVIRNTPEGYGYIINKLDDNHYQLTNNTGASNDVVYGYIWESLRLLADGHRFKFLPKENYPSMEDGSTFEIIVA